jgi:hypothetical protein
LWDYASATPLLHPTKHINKLNKYVKELLFYPILPNGTNIGGLKCASLAPLQGGWGVTLFRDSKAFAKKGAFKIAPFIQSFA